MELSARVHRAADWSRSHLEAVLGGSERTRVIVLLASVLGLASADAATVGAAATPLIDGLHITNTDIGLLVSSSSLVAAVASLPFGVLADRLRRTRLLALSVLAWGAVMLWSATVSTFGGLLLTRLALGLVTAVAGPVVASLVGDYFPSAERGRIYGYILTGELLGAGLGFEVSGDVAAISWRAAFLILALPAVLLGRLLFRLPEPARGGAGMVARPGATSRPAHPPAGASAGGDTDRMPVVAPPPVFGAPASHLAPDDGRSAGAFTHEGAAFEARDPDGARGRATGSPGQHGGRPVDSDEAARREETDAQRLAREKGVEPDPALVLDRDASRLGIFAATRYVLKIRTNVVLIIAGACGYYFLAGVQTFGMEFVRKQYGLGQAVAGLLMLFIGAGAVAGVLVAGRLGDTLLRRGMINARILVSAFAAGLTALAFIPAILTRSSITALPYIVVAAFALGAQNPPIDAARLDIVPPLLWGRAEGVRAMMRTAAQAVAPTLFGVVAEYAFGGGGGHSGSSLKWTFVVMLVPLAANSAILFRAVRTYPRDVATAAASAAYERPAPKSAGLRSPSRSRPGGRR